MDLNIVKCHVWIYSHIVKILNKHHMQDASLTVRNYNYYLVFSSMTFIFPQKFPFVSCPRG